VTAPHCKSRASHHPAGPLVYPFHRWSNRQAHLSGGTASCLIKCWLQGEVKMWQDANVGLKPVAVDKIATLEVAKPPIFSALFHAHEPAAREVENDDHRHPHQVDEWQPVSVVVRNGIQDESSVQEPLDWLMEDDRHQHGERVNQVQVQDVEEHRHATEDQQRPEDTGSGLSIQQRQQQNSRSQRHHQEFQRWRILLDIQEQDESLLDRRLDMPVAL
jgi:hypothetical protein